MDKTISMSLPKFHDKPSLYAGVIVGFCLAVGTLFLMVQSFHWFHLFQLSVGLVLGIHCLDMLRYWKRHRIVRIVKTDTERLIYKETKE